MFEGLQHRSVGKTHQGRGWLSLVQGVMLHLTSSGGEWVLLESNVSLSFPPNPLTHWTSKTSDRHRSAVYRRLKRARMVAKCRRRIVSLRAEDESQKELLS